MIGERTDTRTPDLIQPLLGHRRWNLAYRPHSPLADRWRLWSPFTGGEWDLSKQSGDQFNWAIPTRGIEAGCTQSAHTTPRHFVMKNALARLRKDGVSEDDPRIVALLADFEPTNGHQAPDPSCRCGWYAYHEPEHVHGIVSSVYQVPSVVGTCQMWGTCEVHRTGLRAQYARVVSLQMPDWGTLLGAAQNTPGFDEIDGRVVAAGTIGTAALVALTKQWKLGFSLPMNIGVAEAVRSMLIVKALRADLQAWATHHRIILTTGWGMPAAYGTSTPMRYRHVDDPDNTSY